MESDKTLLWSMMGFMLLQSRTLPNLLHQVYKLWKKYRKNLSAYTNIEIPQYDEASDKLHCPNELYRSVQMYLSSLDATANAPTVSITHPNRNKKQVFNLPSEHRVKDEFQGAQLWWTHLVKTEEKQLRSEIDGTTQGKYTLKISNKDRARVLSSYIDHISEFADNLQGRGKKRKLFSNGSKLGLSSWSSMGSKLGYGNWSSVAFRHPSTFKTLALDPSLKHKIKHDLDCFLQSREFYRKTGRAWKRGYLLYGPPGTGKSSLIAAIANYRNYDVYDLELTRVLDNSNLRQLLLATSSKSVIVIEDIDCAAKLHTTAMSRCPSESHKYESKGARQATSAITLSGLLNFADGLWSSCGEERIMIFTTNHKDRLDPALLRSGRMDMHMHLCYCEFEAFKQLVFNYLDLGDHSLFPSVEEKMKSRGRLTPADICEIFVQNKYNPDAAIKALIDALDSGIPSGNENVIESREDEDEGGSLSSHIQRNKYIRGIYQRGVEEELCGLSA